MWVGVTEAEGDVAKLAGEDDQISGGQAVYFQMVQHWMRGPKLSWGSGGRGADG